MSDGFFGRPAKREKGSSLQRHQLSMRPVVSTTELEDYSEQNFDHFTTILNLKIDGYPFIKSGGFSRDKIKDIANMIRKIPDVVSFNYNPEDVAPM